MIKVFVQGAFELLNAGHVKVFEFCRGQGDILFVGLNTNELLKDYKKREAVLPFEEKKIILESIKYVDAVVPTPCFSPIEILKHLDIDVYCIAEEWRDTKSEEIQYMLSQGKRVVFVPDFGLTRTSVIKARLLDEAKSGV